MRLAREDMMGAICPENPTTTFLDSSIFDYVPDFRNVTFLYGCKACVPSGSLNLPKPCIINGFYYKDVFPLPGFKRLPFCDVGVTFPIQAWGLSQLRNLTGLEESVRGGFLVKWKADGEACKVCTNASKGRCGFDLNAQKFTCLFPNQGYSAQNPSAAPLRRRRGHSFNTQWKIGIGITFAIVGIIAILALTIYGPGKRFLTFMRVTFFVKASCRDNQNVEAMLKTYATLAPRRYSHSEIKKVTHSFKNKLGQGGYGGVFKGELFDGRLVAVNELKGNGEEFIVMWVQPKSGGPFFLIKPIRAVGFFYFEKAAIN